MSENSSEQPTFKPALKSRHIHMIALGGAIGTGVFYGSAGAIQTAGPAVLLVYIVGGAVIFMVMRALGEMCVHEPSTGAFSHYAHKYWSPRAGFVSGWNYWFNYIAVSMVELSVVGTFVQYWFPQIPLWASALTCLVLITCINLLGVKNFGEFEFWFALTKVLAVIAMIVFGIFVIVQGEPGPSGNVPGLHNLVDDGGFAPFGVGGMMACLVVVMFSFGGIELIGITAGEAENPSRVIPRAINQIVFRVLVFYVGALGVIMSVIPWPNIDGRMSPFVQIFNDAGISGAAHLLNFVALTAAISVYNSGLYSNARMLQSLARQGNAPANLGRLSAAGIPFRGVLISSAVTLVAVAVVFLWPEFAFNYLVSIALVSAVVNWTMVVITHWKFKVNTRGSAPNSPRFTVPGGRITAVLVLLFLALMYALMFTSPTYRVAAFFGPIWVAALIIIYTVISRRRRDRRPVEPLPLVAGDTSRREVGPTIVSETTRRDHSETPPP